MKTVIIHTDGGCEGNPGPGGWAAVLRCGEQVREVSGCEPATTNNRMELQAAIGALATLKEPCAVTLHTDSSYLRNGITQWLKGWKRNGWRTASREPVKNDDLWKQLDAATAPHRIEWRWLKGHAGHADNERCDQLAAAEMAKLRQTYTRAQLAALRDQFVASREPKPAMIEPGFGLLKRQPGDLPFAEEWAEHKREEKELEEAKQARHGSQ